EALLPWAAEALKNASTPLAAALWLDGFAEMTAQELALLAAVAPHCQKVTLAFCLPGQLDDEPSWLSTWSVVAQTFRRCSQQLQAVPGGEVVVEVLERSPDRSRFSGSPDLRRLEAAWADAGAEAVGPVPVTAASIRLLTCANPEGEAVQAAREILRF